MAIDPNIIFQSQTPGQLQQAALAVQQQQQQLQAAKSQNVLLGQEVQKNTIAMRAQQALNDAMRTAVTTGADGQPVFDHQAISQHLIQAGAGHLVASTLEQLQKVDETAAGINEKKAQAAKLNQDVQTAQSDYAGTLGLAVKDQGYDPRAAIGAIAHALSTKNMDPQTANALTQHIVANPTPQTVQSIIDPLISQSPKAQEVIKSRAQATEAGARANEANVNAGATTAKLPGALAAQQLQAEKEKADTTVAQQKAAGTTPLTAKDILEARMRQQQLGIEGRNSDIGAARLRLEKERAGFEQNGGVSPIAQTIAEGKIDPQTVRNLVRKNPGILAQVKSVDPNFDMADMDKRFEVLKEFTSSSNSKAGGQVLALNTMIHHADLYQQVASSLKNGSFKPGNAAYNAVAQAFGQAPPVNTKLVAQFLAGETAKLAQGGAPFESEVHRLTDALSTSSSPDQIAQAGKTLLQVASGRAIPLQEKVTDAKLQDKVRVVGPDAQAILQRNGYDPNTLKPAATQAKGGTAGFGVAAPNGKTYHFKSQADADAFKREAGIK